MTEAAPEGFTGDDNPFLANLRLSSEVTRLKAELATAEADLEEASRRIPGPGEVVVQLADLRAALPMGTDLGDHPGQFLHEALDRLRAAARAAT